MPSFPQRSALVATLLFLASAATAPGAVVRAQPLVSTTNLPSVSPRGDDPLTGVRSPLPKDWVGVRTVSPDTPILMLAGHADAQGIGGAGTAGEAVARLGAAPMYPGITDEHYWNLVIAHAVTVQGRQRGLRIDFHKPPVRTILNGDAPGTNWSEGRRHALAGGYALEIHFDAYGPSGVGSGLIPPLHRPFSRIDESLAQEFGAYPMTFRDRLGGPKRGIALLEIGKLEGNLEASLRDPATRDRAVKAIANRVLDAIERGMGRTPTPTAQARPPLTPPPRVERRQRRGRNPQASSAGE